MKRALPLLCLFVALGANAQSLKQWTKFGDAAADKGDHYGAALYYRQALDMEPGKLQLQWKYAEALRGYNHYEVAEEYYGKVYKKDRGKIYPEGLFWLATMQKCNGHLEESIDSWKRLQQKHKQDKASYTYRKATQEMAACAFALGLKEDSLELEVENLGPDINTTESEFSAFLPFDNDSSLYFSTLRGNVNEAFEVSGEYVVRIHSGTLGRSADHGPLDSLINASGTHNANGTFNLSGNQFYFSRCNEDHGCKLMVANKLGNRWSVPQLASGLNGGHTSTQPMIAKVDGKEVLFFSSDRSGGQGKLDIWYAISDGEGFGPPQNAGAHINSIDNEITPFWSEAEQQLYFSSDWHKGLGGYDIFKAGLLSGEPQNLGYPINTHTNDVYYAHYPDYGFALLASNRKGSLAVKGETCCNDIYRVQLEPDSVEEEIPEFTTLEELNRYLPVTLYFHNDEPNPRSTDTTTALSYTETYEAYRALLPVYEKEYATGLKGDEASQAKEDINAFFVEKVEQGAIDLEVFTKLLLNELAKGQKVELTVKGFASPLAKTDYNVNLTSRRVQSLINYMNNYRGGVFRQYMEREAKNGGSLSFVKIPFGEYKAGSLVSDNLNDLRNSVYSRAAALERKIEIISVQQAASDSLGPLPQFDREIVDLGTVQFREEVEATFKLSNVGDQPLEILSVVPDCGCTMPNLENSLLAPGESTTITLQYNGTGDAGKFVKNVTLITNAENPERVISLSGELVFSEEE